MYVLADLVHILPVYLLSLFKKNTGKRLYVFIAKAKINKTRLFLITTDDTIDAIAMRCGYESPARFRRACKKLNGISASEYSAKLKG